MTTPTANPTARERRTVKLLQSVTRELEGLGHQVELLGFVPDRVDGVAVDVPRAGDPKVIAAKISAIVKGTAS